MPFYQTEHTLVYYNLFVPNFMIQAKSPPERLLLVHGFAGTPTSDFAGQLPTLRQD